MHLNVLYLISSIYLSVGYACITYNIYVALFRFLKNDVNAFNSYYTTLSFSCTHDVAILTTCANKF